MSETVLIVAPHADDEALGCGGTILRHKNAGDAIHWMLVTDIPEGGSIGGARSDLRNTEIAAVSEKIGFDGVHRLGFPPTTLDELPLSDIISSMSEVVQKIEPSMIYMPFGGDVHSDHGIVFKAACACTKWFRYPSIKSVRVYETLSETNFALDPTQAGYRPNLYVDISEYMDAKLEVLNIFKSEMGAHPFPRSNRAVQALATLRGSEAGVDSAESFMLLKQID